MRSYIRFTVGLVLVAISMIYLSACEKPPTETDLKTSLGKLAEEYWNKRVMDRDYKATYDMEAVEGTLPFPEYLQRVKNAGQIQYRSIKTKDVKVEKDKGTVDMVMRCILPGVPQEMDLSYSGDKWVLKSGRWKHVLRKK